MSQTSSTPSHVHSRDARQHRAPLEEIQRLQEALKETQNEMEFLKEELEKERAEKRTLWIENRRLRGPDHETSGDQTSIQQWQDRAEEAERRAEEAERELSRIQGSLAEFNDAWRDIGQAYANVTGQNRDLNPAGQVEREAHSRTSGSDQDVVMTGDGTRPVSDRPSMRKSRGGSQNSGNPLAHEPNAVSLLGSDLHHGSSLQSSLSSRSGLKRPFEPEVGGLEGPSLRRPPPVPTHLRESPPQRPSFVETIDPSDRNAAASHVAGGEMNLTNRPEHHANTQEASPTGGESPSSTDSESSGFPTVASLVRANLVASTAPAIPRRDTPVPRPELRVKSPIAAGKQPECPSPAKEASSATGGEPPKPAGTSSYAGATPARPSEVRARSGLAQTAQSSRTFSKTGNAAATTAVPQTNARPANQANTKTDYSNNQATGTVVDDVEEL